MNSLTLLQSPLKEQGFMIPTSFVGDDSALSTIVVLISGLLISGFNISDLFLGSCFICFSISCQEDQQFILVCSFVTPSNITSSVKFKFGLFKF